MRYRASMTDSAFEPATDEGLHTIKAFSVQTEPAQDAVASTTAFSLRWPIGPIGGELVEVATEGNDTLHGTSGNDTTYGLGGNDILFGSAGADFLHGGDGFDTVDYSASAHSVWVDAQRGLGGFGDADGDTYASIEKVVGSNYDDFMFANSAGMTLDGNLGNDYLTGNSGNDVIIGGAGYDTLTGGGGSDTFVVGLNTGYDRIVDFQEGIDKIGLQGLDPSVLGKDHELARGFFTSEGDLRFVGANFDSSDKIYFDTVTNQLRTIDSTWINGHLSNYRSDLIATFDDNITLHTYDLSFV